MSNTETVLYVNIISFQCCICLISGTSNEISLWPCPFCTCLQSISSVLYLDIGVISSFGVVCWYLSHAFGVQLHQCLLLVAPCGLPLLHFLPSSYELSVRVFLRWNSSLRLLLSVQCRTTQSGLNQHFPVDSVISWCLACLCHHLEKMSSFS